MQEGAEGLRGMRPRGMGTQSKEQTTGSPNPPQGVPRQGVAPKPACPGLQSINGQTELD